MELELHQEHHAFCEALPTLGGAQEETAETVIPDYCPDIARIVDAQGALYLRSREVTDGRVTVSGVVKANVLYIADGAQGVKSFEYTLPFEQTLDGRLPEGANETTLDGRLDALDVRLVNPRKLFTRAALTVSVAPYRSAMLVTCGELGESAAYHIQTRCEQREASLIEAIREKDFTFTDEFTVPGTKGAVRELLRSRVCLRGTETRVIGSKVALKGVACVELLYRTDDDALAQTATELPFSQILEGLDGEGFEASATLRMTGAEVRAGSDSAPDDERTVSVRVYCSASVLLRRTVSVCCITDLYSTTHELTADLRELTLSCAPTQTLRELTVRETLETGTDAADVLCTDVSFGPVSVLRDGDTASLRASATIRALYRDGSGALLAAERRVELTAPTDAPQPCHASVRPLCAGEITCAPTAGGLEVRFPAVFVLESACTTCRPCLTALRAEEESVRGEARPSLILRALEAGEALWDVAKRYRTSVEEILAANELAEEAAAAVGELLLIPNRH